MNYIDDWYLELVLRTKPRQFLIEIMNRGVKISCSIDELTDDECARIARDIIEEVQPIEALC